MKLSTLLVLATSTLALAIKKPKMTKKPKNDDPNTYFNSVKVPPMLELTPDNFDKEINATKFVVVKHYSPYCPHCIDYAPTYQTLYEYYYTSKPVTTEDVSFMEFYDIRFATINCVAFFDLCASLKVQSYPTTILYKDGQAAETVKGVKGLDVLTTAFEPFLEAAKPGTRPKELNLPNTGDKQTPDFSPAAAMTSDTKTDAAAGSETGDLPKAAPEEGKDESSATPDKTTPEETVPSPKKTIPEAPPKPTETFNPDGVSVALTAEKYETLVTGSKKPWFINFYAPWCHHCQALAPTWAQLGKEMKDKLNIGEVNCDVEAKLCKEVGVRAFPTLLFIKGTERAEYEGLRGLGDLKSYGEGAAAAAVGVVDVDAAALEALEQKEEVVFVYFYDHATTSEDFASLEKMPVSLVGRARIVKTQDPKLAERYKITTFPRLLVSRSGRPTYYNPLTPREMRDVEGILAWMRSVWLPMVPELVATNSREIMDGKIVVLAIINRNDAETLADAKRELNKAANDWMDKQIVLFQKERQELRDAKQLKIDEAENRGDERAKDNAKLIRVDMSKSPRKEVAFAWIDGVFWQRWLKTTYGIDVSTGGNRVIINDEDRHRYWDVTDTNTNILLSHTSILDTLPKVTASPPEIRPKTTLSFISKLFFDFRMSFVDHPFLSVGAVLAIMIAGAGWVRNRMRRHRGGHFVRLDDSWSTKELMKEGLIGGGPSGNGKVD
ncbi:hypothetical protein VDGD_00502 [Verticillium dahliae]|nr:hypothetical protein VdG1_01864 [Verticillium dahliae VDG1]RBQ97682.1 hypothetical protein VDGD_00502 [Verticillium dahliae]